MVCATTSFTTPCTRTTKTRWSKTGTTTSTPSSRRRRRRTGPRRNSAWVSPTSTAAILPNDLVNHSLEVFWEHNVFHFGILDCPGRHFSLDDMDEAFVALKALDASVQKARASGNTSYIVLGAVANYDKWYDYFESKVQQLLQARPVHLGEPPVIRRA
ncbi:hypothetical protein MTO96_007948 [Rhipicephalus appendiculatus]